MTAPADTVELLSYPEQQVPAALRVQVLALQQLAWPDAPDEPGHEPGHDPGRDPGHDPLLDPQSLLLVGVADRTVVAALDVLSKEIVHEGRRYAASGLSRVVTAPDRRGRGHGRRLVAAAHAAVRDGGADLALFTCDTPLRGFYESAGWRHLPGTYLIGGTPEEPFPSFMFDKVTMGDFFSPLAREHAADFLGRNIRLHSGAIDKLW